MFFLFCNTELKQLVSFTLVPNHCIFPFPPDFLGSLTDWMEIWRLSKVQKHSCSFQGQLQIWRGCPVDITPINYECLVASAYSNLFLFTGEIYCLTLKHIMYDVSHNVKWKFNRHSTSMYKLYTNKHKKWKWMWKNKVNLEVKFFLTYKFLLLLILYRFTMENH